MAIGTPVCAYTSGVQTSVANSGALTLPAINTKPTSTNDCMVVRIYCSNENTTVTSFSGGGGTWSPRATVPDAGTIASLFIFTKQATATDISGATYTLQLANTSANGHLLYTIDIIPGGTFDSVSDSGSGKVTPLVNGTPQTLCTAALAPSTNADLFLATAGAPWASTSTVTFSVPTNYTLFKSYADSTYGSFYGWYRQKSADSTSEQPSSTPTFTGTDNNSTDSVVLAFKASVTVGPITSTPSSVSFSTATTTISVSDPNNTGTVNVSSSNTAAFTVSPASFTGAGPQTITITGVASGSGNVVLTDGSGNTTNVATTYTAYGPLTLSPTSLTFTGPSAATQTFTASETNYSGPFTATSSNTAIATVSPPTNLAPNSDSLSGWTLSGFSLGTGGPSGATDAEYTGTGSAIVSGLEVYSPAITVVPGTVYTPSWWVDGSQVTHGGYDVRIQSTDGATNYADVSFTTSPNGLPAGRYAAASWTCPVGVTSVRMDVFCWPGQAGGFIVAAGQKLKLSQPMFEAKSSASSTYAANTATLGPGPITFTVTPVAPGSATITVTDNHSGSQTVAVTVNTPGPLTVTGTGTFTGSTTTLSVADTGNDKAITATVNDTTVATVSPASGTGAGPITFTVTGQATGTTYITFADTYGNQKVETISFTAGGGGSVVSAPPLSAGTVTSLPLPPRLLLTAQTPPPPPPQAVEIALDKFGGDFVLAPNGDLALITDTFTSTDATRQRLERMLMTSPTLADVDQVAIGRADDIFNPHYGAGLPAMVGEPNTATLVNGARARILAALAADPEIAQSPPPVVTVDSVDAVTVLFSISCKTVSGQSVTLPPQPLRIIGG